MVYKSNAVYSKAEKTEDRATVEKTHNIYQGSKAYIVLNSEDIDDVLPEVFQTIFVSRI